LGGVASYRSDASSLVPAPPQRHSATPCPVSHLPPPSIFHLRPAPPHLCATRLTLWHALITQPANRSNDDRTHNKATYRSVKHSRQPESGPPPHRPCRSRLSDTAGECERFFVTLTTTCCHTHPETLPARALDSPRSNLQSQFPSPRATRLAAGTAPPSGQTVCTATVSCHS
jgi:hypothetical protein